MALIILDSFANVSEDVRKELQEMLDDKEQIRTAVSATFASLSPGKKPPYLYASTPISTGRRLTEGMLKYGHSTKEEFKRKNPDAYTNEVVAPNIDDGNQCTLDCEKHFGKTFAPSRFAGGLRWKDSQYMVFYRPIVEKGCWGMAFNDRSGYTHSTGCVEEFAMGLEHGKKLYLWKGPGQFIEADPQVEMERMLKAMVEIRSITGQIPPRFAEYWLDIAVRVGISQSQVDIKKFAQAKNG